MSNYKSNYTGAVIDAAVNKASSIPQPTSENVGKVLSVVNTGKEKYGYEFITSTADIRFMSHISTGMHCELSFDEVQDLIRSPGIYVNAYLSSYRAIAIEDGSNVITFTFIHPDIDYTMLMITVISYNSDNTISDVTYSIPISVA